MRGTLLELANKYLHDDSFGLLFVQALLIISVYVVLFLLTQHYSARLPESSYFTQFLLKESLVHRSFNAFLFIAPCFIFYRRCTWNNLDSSKHLKSFLLIVCAALFWQFGFYEFNFYFNQLHIWDRTLLGIFFLLIFRHPLFLVLFLWQLMLIQHQFAYPFAISVTDKEFVIKAVLLFIAFLYARIACPKLQTRHYLFVLLCLMGSHYLWPMISKAMLSWHGINNISHLFIATYESGWLASVPKSRALYFANLVSILNPLLIIGAELIQISSLFLLIKRKWTPYILVVLILFHIAVFALSGILFWLWVVTDLALIFFLLRADTKHFYQIFGIKPVACSLIFMALAQFYFFPPKLGWYDTPLSKGYDWVAVLEDGSRAVIHKNDFAPYDIYFNQADFSFAEGRKQLVGVYGSTLNRDVVYALQNIMKEQKPNEYFQEVTDSYGVDLYDENYANKLKNFVRTTFQNTNANLPLHRKGTFAPPPHFNPFRNDEDYSFNQPIQEIQLYSWGKYYVGTDVVPLYRDLVFTISL